MSTRTLGVPSHLVFLALWPVAVAFALQVRFDFAPGPTGALVAASCFFLGTLALGLFSGVPTAAALVRAFAQMVAGAVALLVICGISGWPSLGLGMTAVVFVVAIQEEIIFRVALPRWLVAAQTHKGLGLGMSRLVAGGVSQVSFALAHGPAGPLDSSRFIALVTIGLFLLTIRSVAGLGAAAALHAFLNLTAMEARSGYQGVPLSEALAVLSVAIFVYSASEIARSRRPHMASDTRMAERRLEVGPCDGQSMQPL